VFCELEKRAKIFEAKMRGVARGAKKGRKWRLVHFVTFDNKVG